MRVTVTSIPVSDQDKALKFYTEKLGFVKKHDVVICDDGSRWLTVVSPEEPNGVEVVLEPNGEYPAMKALKESLVRDGIPITLFEVDDVYKEQTRLQELGVEITKEPMDAGTVIFMTINDTCGNLLQIQQMKPQPAEG